MDELTADFQNATAIRVRSRRQAMDWSLVLASQQIESRIACDSGRWTLWVETQDAERALGAIRQYVGENRRWRWQEALLPDFQFHWGSLLWALSLVLVHGYASPGWREAATMDSQAVAAGQWWRLLTAIFLHKNAAHLAGNAVFGFLLLGLAMAEYGAGPALLFSFAAGGAGNLLAWFGYHSHYQSLGASGMVMGALGLVAVQSAAYWRRRHFPGNYAARAAAAGALLFVLLGLDPTADVLAHLGGFLFGVVGGLLWISCPPEFTRRPAVQTACGLVCAALAGVALALSFAHAVR